MIRTYAFSPTDKETQALLVQMLNARNLNHYFVKVGSVKGESIYQLKCDTDKHELANEVLFSKLNSCTKKQGGANPSADSIYNISFNGFSLK